MIEKMALMSRRSFDDYHLKQSFLAKLLLSYVLTTLKTDRNSSLSDRPALPLVA